MSSILIPNLIIDLLLSNTMIMVTNEEFQIEIYSEPLVVLYTSTFFRGEKVKHPAIAFRAG